MNYEVTHSLVTVMQSQSTAGEQDEYPQGIYSHA